MRAVPECCFPFARTEEGLRLVAYPDPASGGAPWTAGYGHTGPDVYPGLTVTKAKAEEWLRADLENAAAIVEEAVTVPLTDNQFAALTLFVMNVGAGRKARGKDAGKDGFLRLKTGRPSTLLTRLNAGDYAGAAAEFPKWVHGSGKIMPGLVKRRAKEAALFLEGIEHEVTQVPEPAPAPKPVIRSASGLSGVGALGLGGVAVLLDQAREVSAAAKGLLDALPSGTMGWAIALVLAVAVVALLVRQHADGKAA